MVYFWKGNLYEIDFKGNVYCLIFNKKKKNSEIIVWYF